MELGIFTEFNVREGVTQSEAFDESISQVELAVRLGINLVWLSEFHFSPERSVLSSPLNAASFIAARTSRINIEGLEAQVLPKLA